MSVAEYEGVAAPQTGQIVAEDFSGGWNSRDADSQVGENEFPDGINMTLDERGGAVQRLGLESAGALAAAGLEGFEWKAEQKVVVQVGRVVYVGGDLGSLSAIKTFSADGKAAFCDFLSKLVFVHPTDGVFAYTTSGGVVQSGNMSQVKGTTICAWQNAVRVTGDPRPDYRTYVWRSALADPLTWDVSATGPWVALREKDDASLVAFGTQGGQDVVGKPGLIVCKAESVYRINDPTTGAYTTLHAEAGAAGPLAITESLGETVMMNRAGIWVTNGIDPPELVSQKIAPLFRKEQIDFDQLSKVCAGVYNDRVLFSLPRIIRGATPAANNFTLEYHPELGWIVPHDFGMAAFARDPSTGRLFGLPPATSKALYVFKGGSDDGADIAARLQTKWFEPTRGINNRFRRIRIKGRGSFSFYTRRDYTLGKGELRDITISSGGGKWNDGEWNDGRTWGPERYEGYVDEPSLGVAESISFSFEHTGSSSSTSRTLLGDGVAAEVGAFAVYGFLVDFIKLGNA